MSSQQLPMSLKSGSMDKPALVLYMLSVVACLCLGLYLLFISFKRGPCFSKWYPRGIAIYIIFVTVVTLASAGVLWMKMGKML